MIFNKVFTFTSQHVNKSVHIVVTKPCVSLHSLDNNEIGSEGCTALGAALKGCRKLEVLR